MLCGVFGTLEQGLDDDADDQERAQALIVLLGQVITDAQRLATAEASALLRVCAVLGPVQTRAAAGEAAGGLAAAGVPERSWAPRVGHPMMLRAWRYGDVFGGAVLDRRAVRLPGTRARRHGAGRPPARGWGQGLLGGPGTGREGHAEPGGRRDGGQTRPRSSRTWTLRQRPSTCVRRWPTCPAPNRTTRSRTWPQTCTWCRPAPICWLAWRACRRSKRWACYGSAGG